MKLAELIPLVKVEECGQGFGVRIKPHARASWGGRAYVSMHWDDSQMRLYFDGRTAPWAVNFDDAMADDWELVP